MDWGGWLIFGVVATAALTAVLIAAQMAGLTRMDLPLILGTAFVGDPDRARLAGAAAHVVAGQVFALGYVAFFAALGQSPLWLGAALGAMHAAVAVGLIVPLLPGVHPRMVSERAGLRTGAALEPPGWLCLNYGLQTPLVTLAAHVVYGVALAALLQPV